MLLVALLIIPTQRLELLWLTVLFRFQKTRRATRIGIGCLQRLLAALMVSNQKSMPIISLSSSMSGTMRWLTEMGGMTGSILTLQCLL